MTRRRLGSSASTASRDVGTGHGVLPRAGSPTTTCSHPTCSGTARRRTSRPGASRRTWSCSSPLSGRSRPRGSDIRSAAASPSRSQPGIPSSSSGSCSSTRRSCSTRRSPCTSAKRRAPTGRMRRSRKGSSGASWRAGSIARHESSWSKISAGSSSPTSTVAGAIATARPPSLPPTGRWPPRPRPSTPFASRPCSCSARTRTSRTTTCSTTTALRSATCSRSSRCRVGTP